MFKFLWLVSFLILSFDTFAETFTKDSLVKESSVNNNLDKSQNIAMNKNSKTHKKYGNKRKNKGKQQEYSGDHSLKNIRMAVGSKAFSWLSGSPADNEKLSVGKTAQFFGFVALRYQSGRAARRGSLGRSFYQIATDEQRQIIHNAVLSEDPIMKKWWQVRSQLLKQLEQYLYTGVAWDEEELLKLGGEFGYLNAEAGRIEMQAFAEVEKLLTSAQWQQLHRWREDPALVTTNKVNRANVGLSRELTAQYEDLFAKSFSLFTGNFNDRKIVPLGQPAQFFGFVSIRHKSGHGASRGKISKQFYQLLTPEQSGYLKHASQQLVSPTGEFMAVRTRLLQELDKLRLASNETFDAKQYEEISRQLGIIETRCAMIEAAGYKQVRASMSETQMAELMEIRSDYILDQGSIENSSVAKRGEKLYLLCQGCHNNKAAPDLTGVFGREIASMNNYDYSRALLGQAGKFWDEKTLSVFLTNPTKAIPGTKMEFTGLMNEQDRQALIQYIQQQHEK
jgi:cytochrome c2